VGKSVIKTSALALVFLLLPSLAAAAGLGKLTVLSGLGQPLKAEIELLAMQKGEADNLSVRLPSADAFRKANIEYSGALLSVKFSIEQRGVDRYVVVLSSTQPMNEPFLDLLVELDWTTGRLVREYTFLLDPPEYKGSQPAPAMAAPAMGAPVIKSVEMPKQPAASAIAPSVDRPLAAPVPVAPRAAAPRAVAPKAVAPRATATNAAPTAAASYQVKPGDTLTKIANANKSDNVSLQQMLIALYRSNADAFDGNNINRMRAGRILNIPDAETAASFDQDEAARTVLAQAADFNDYRRKLGAAVVAAPERADQRRQSASGKITARVEDKPAASKDAKDQLKLSKVEEPGKPGAKRSPQGLQEDLFAKEKELKEANGRIAMLQKNVQDMQKLLELKSQSGAQLQQQAAKAGAAKAVEPAKTPEPVKAPEPAKAADAAKTPGPAKAVEPAKTEDAAKAAPMAVAPKAPPKVIAPPPPVPEPSLIDEILGNELALYGGGGFLLLLFAGYGYYAWRRKKTLQKMESSVMGAPDLATDSVFGAAGGAKVDTGPSEIQGDFSQGGSAAAIDTEEVDPIAEADVYMAYGRDTQAEEILKEALAKDPSRQPIRAKLLEIYANRKDAKAFEMVAAEIHAATNGEGAEWEKALALGAQLDPGNPLYSGKSGAGGVHAVTDTQVVSGAQAAPDVVPETGGELEASPGLDFDLGLGEPAHSGAPQPEAAPAEGAAPPAEVTADLGFDLDLGDAEKKPEVAPAKQPQPSAAADSALSLEGAAAEAPAVAAASIDFDFELPESSAAAQPATPPAAAPEAAAAEGGGGIDFDFNLDLPAQKEEAPSAPLDLSAISLDLGSPGEAVPPPDAHWQEVATKLDLAKAYQEMGDKDGARELLNEVLKEGDAAQQQQAQTMLTTLG
jgi:pilus assembly protein FimV